ncbi:carnosine N-methyltransferase [Macrobrachium rosenbergii]|uniref:carnosine N-methyltransferase n=1 Tax=Macrobrachium rosenbergii TaxID=79674 RepID=UPI0034D6326C
MSSDDMDYSGAQERAHFQRIVQAFKSYRSHALKHVKEREEYIQTLPSHHRELLSSYRSHLKKQKVCIQHNGEIINQIINGVESMFENVQHEPLNDVAQDVSSLDLDIEKVKSTIRQIVRDWSPLGEKERSLCYGPVIEQIVRLYPPDCLDTSSINILVPGAGLGRLAHEIARRGYSCQGNEFSLFMLMASNFILNKCRGPNSLRVYPWVHTGSNQLTNENQLQEATFPDQDPSELPPQAQFTIAAGDFLEIYTEADSWDCIATSFFIDCASNIVAFIETIFKILKPGGYWVNLGPLLYHFEEQPDEHSIELSYEEVRHIVEGLGFEITVEKTSVETTYTQNANSMMHYGYRSIFFVARKPS